MEKKETDPTMVLKPCSNEECNGYVYGLKSTKTKELDKPCQACLRRRYEQNNPRRVDFFVMPSMFKNEMNIVRA